MHYFRQSTAWLLVFLLAFASPVQAEFPSTVEKSPYRYPFFDGSPRSVFMPPLLSGIIPGFDQWIEGQYSHALTYTLMGAGGFLLFQSSSDNIDNRYRNFGLQIYLTAGATSLFHSFRSAVNSRKNMGDFRYIKKDETLSDLYGSALKFSYLGRWSTLFPLISGIAVFFLLDNSQGTKLPAQFGDFFYAGTTSYMTGVSEELFFRGYLMPMMYHYTGDSMLANLIQGGAYGVAHGLRFKHFVTATLFGLYSGWIVQKQDWELGEMIFVHTWMDLISFLADYANHREPSALSIPLVMMTF